MKDDLSDVLIPSGAGFDVIILTEKEFFEKYLKKEYEKNCGTSIKAYLLKHIQRNGNFYNSDNPFANEKDSLMIAKHYIEKMYGETSVNYFEFFEKHEKEISEEIFPGLCGEGGISLKGFFDQYNKHSPTNRDIHYDNSLGGLNLKNLKTLCKLAVCQCLNDLAYAYDREVFGYFAKKRSRYDVKHIERPYFNDNVLKLEKGSQRQAMKFGGDKMFLFGDWDEPLDYYEREAVRKIEEKEKAKAKEKEKGFEK